MKLHELQQELEQLAMCGLRDAQVEAVFPLADGRVVSRPVVTADRAGPGPERVVLITTTARQQQAAEEKANDERSDAES